MNKEKNEGPNLEEINRKNILNFGNLSTRQYNRATARGFKGVNWDEAWIKCRRCSNRRKAKWNGIGWDINENAGEDYWKVYLFKSQVEKIGVASYQIISAIEFYCSKCDRHHNHWED